MESSAPARIGAAVMDHIVADRMGIKRIGSIGVSRRVADWLASDRQKSSAWARIGTDSIGWDWQQRCV